MVIQKMIRIAPAFYRAVEFILREKRLPGRLTENPIVQSLGYLKAWLKNQLKSVDLEDAIFVCLPNIGHRYIYQTLHLLSLAYPNVIFILNFSLENYIKLGYEGRRLFSIQNLKILSQPPLKISESTTILNSAQNYNSASQWSQAKLRIFMESDVSKSPDESSFLIPYGVHPSLLQNYDQVNHEIVNLQTKTRSISIFFSGIVGYVTDPHLVERYYNIPSRLRCVEFLVEHSEQLNIHIIRNAQERRKFTNCPEDYKKFALVLGLCKGSPKKWLIELSNADFFLALPGGYMPMCHNVIEAMAVGTIPILSYENYFFPALTHGKNCLAYRHLEDLPGLIKSASQMDHKTIEAMRNSAIEYYSLYLNPSKVANFIRHYQGSTMRLYINHEDAETLRQVTDASILRQGGSLQCFMEEQEPSNLS
jgi:glycosyltransferase involved in cell wall biosynthesis